MNYRNVRPQNACWMALTLLVLAVACQGVDVQTVVSTKTAIVASATPTPSAWPPTLVASVTSSPSPSATATRLPTSTPMPTITWTPLPTLSSAKALGVVEDLLRNNAGCRLPCWWGITPGETAWETARHFLASFVVSFGQGESGEITEAGVTYLATGYSAYYKIPGEPFDGATIYSLRNGLIDNIWVTPARGTDRSYQLHQMLIDYGEPTEVWLQTTLNVPVSPLPFRVFLYYPQKGILAYYEYKVTRKVGDQLWGCPEPIGPQLWLWSPERPLTIDDIQPIGPDARQLQPLEDATGMDIATFYQTFKESNTSSCLITPVEFWP